MASLKVALPNELWRLILSDVIGSYIHSFILLPSSCHCWPGHYVLRSVSKRIKVLVDDIWASVIGRGDHGQRELVEIRGAILDLIGHPLPKGPSKPIIAAYAYYMASLYAQEYSSVSLGQDRQPFTTQSNRRRCLESAFTLAYKVHPREVSYYLRDNLEAALDSWIFAEETLATRRVIKAAVRVVTQCASLSGEALERLLGCTHYVLVVWTSGGMKACFMDYEHTVDLELIRSSLALQQPPGSLGSYPKSDGLLREEISSYIVLLNGIWLEQLTIKESRKRELHRAATYGIRKQRLTDS